MNNKAMEARLAQELSRFIDSQKSLQLSSLQQDGRPYASYAPFAIGNDCLYLLLSEVALHATNLQHNPKASVLIIEDEASAAEVFARKRVNYSVDATLLARETPDWSKGIDTLRQRHGERISHLSQHADFKLFQLMPQGGRYVKDFGRAYSLEGKSLTGEVIEHLRGGHKVLESA